MNEYRKSDGTKLEISTKLSRLIAVTKFIKVMDQFEIVDGSFLKKFKLPRKPRKNYVDVPDLEEVELICHQALIARRMGLRNRAIAEVFFATGIRRLELVNLTLRDIDFRHQTLNILKGKNSEDRVIPIAPRALQWIARYLKEQRPVLATLSSGDTLFLTEKGDPMKPYKVTDMMSNCVKRSGIDKKGACHILRHFTATEMIRNGADLFQVQEMLGHIDISSTRRYVHFIIDDLHNAYSRSHPAAMPQKTT